MKIDKTDFAGSPHIGVFCVVNDDFAVLPLATPQKFEDMIKETLEVDIIKTNMADTPLLGIFSAANNKRILVPKILEKNEIQILKEHFSEVIALPGKNVAVGNLIAMNDHGAVRSRYLAQRETVAKCTAIEEMQEATVGWSDFVGSAVFVTNSGFLAHRDASEKEIKKLESIFKVKGDNCTVNMGDPFVKCGLVGNKKGILAGSLTSGPELMRISEVFL